MVYSAQNSITSFNEAIDTLFPKTTTIFESVQFLNEGSFESPFNGLIERIERIKDSKPNEGTAAADIKDFIDKYYTDIKKYAKILEKEPKNITEAENKMCLKHIPGLVLSMLTLLIGSYLHIAFAVIGVIALLISVILMCIDSLKVNERFETAQSVRTDMNKIKKSLETIRKRSDLDASTKSKIFTLIEKISDAESEWKDYDKKRAESRDAARTSAMIAMAANS